MQLLVQLAILALVLGSDAFTMEYLLLLSFPLSFILTGLYTSEDRLVGHIISYLNSLSKGQGQREDLSVPNLESSVEGKGYTKTAIPVRLLAQFFSFLVLPLGILAFRLLSGFVHPAESIVGVLFSLVIGWLLFSTYRLRVGTTK
jgi:hypothetical protein